MGTYRVDLAPSIMHVGVRSVRGGHITHAAWEVPSALERRSFGGTLGPLGDAGLACSCRPNVAWYGEGLSSAWVWPISRLTPPLSSASVGMSMASPMSSPDLLTAEPPPSSIGVDIRPVDALDNVQTLLKESKDLLSLAPVPGLSAAVGVLLAILDQVKVRRDTHL